MNGLDQLYKLISILIKTDINEIKVGEIRPLTNDIEKELKVLKIVINKKIDFVLIDISYSAEDYNGFCKQEDCEREPITNDEFDLLKEVLKNE